MNQKNARLKILRKLFAVDRGETLDDLIQTMVYYRSAQADHQVNVPERILMADKPIRDAAAGYIDSIRAANAEREI